MTTAYSTSESSLVRFRRFGIGAILSLALSNLVACSSPTGTELIDSDCAANNPNCQEAELTAATSGASSNLSLRAVKAGDALGTVPMKDTRESETTSLTFELTNLRLLPLRSFSLTPSVSGTYAISSGGANDCGSFSVLFYSQTCTVTISYTPGTEPPDLDLVFHFKTLLGGDVSFTAKVGRPNILSDFYLAPAASFANELVFDNLALSGTAKDFTVTNYGNVDDLTGMAFSIIGNDADEFSLATTGTNDCAAGQTVAKNGGQCSLRVVYKPQRPGLKSAQLLFVSTNGYSRAYAISTTGLRLAASTPALSYQPAAVSGATQDLTVNITNPPNNGSAIAQSCAANITGSPRFSIVTNGCGAAVNAGVTCPITVRFTPDAAAGWHAGDLTLSCDSRGGQLTVPLYAETVTAQLVADSTLVDFGDIVAGSSATRALTLTNASGTTALTNLATALATLSGSGLTVAGTTCGSTLAAASSCAVTLTFAPTGAGPAASGFSASSDLGGLDRAVIVKGRGLAPRVNFAAIDFGSVMTGLDRNGAEITVVNPSTTETMSGCALDTSALAAAGFSLLPTSTCPTTAGLAPGSSCVIHPKFTATGSTGARTAALTFNCLLGGSATVNLHGGVVSDARLGFLPVTAATVSDRLVGITTTVDFTLTNSHSADNVAGLAVTTPGIALPWSRVAAGASDCSLAAGLSSHQACLVSLQYSPTAAGATSGSIAASGQPSASASATYSGVASQITPSVSSIDFGTVRTGIDSAVVSVAIANPSGIDDATTCAPSVTAPFTLVSQTCASTLAQSSVCTFGVQVPSQAASANLSGTASLNCSTTGGQAAIALTAAVKKKPSLAWSGTAAFGSVDLGQSLTQTLTLTHTGAPLDSPTSGLSLSLAAGSSSDFSIVSHNCPAALSPGSSCTVDVRYAPSAAASVAGTLRAAEAEVTEDLSLSGTGIDSSLRVVPSTTSISDTGRLVGMTINQDITLSNNAVSGDATGLNVGTPSNGAPWSLGASASPCGATLNLGATCQVRLVYHPTAVGTTSGTVAISASNMTPSKTIAYSGTATQISPSTSSLDFGVLDYGQALTHGTVVTITNPSPTDTASGCSLTASAPFVINTTTCGATLAPGGTCTLQAELPAQNSDLTLNGTADMTCTVGGTASVALNAQVAYLPKLAWQNAPSAAFGDLDLDASAVGRTYTIVNNGTSTVTLTSFGLSSSSPGFALTGGTCTSSTVLAASASCTATVTFHPLSTGNETAVLRAGVSSPVASNFDLNLSGAGSTMSLGYSATSLSFTTREVGQPGSETKSITITNNGTRTANFTYSSLTNPPFLQGGTCGATLAAGASCSLQVSASAAAAPAAHSATLTVTESNGATTRDQDITLSGQTIAAPVLQIADNIANTTPAASIATTDITGATGTANNIIDKSPSSRTVTYTLQNSAAAGAATLGSINVALSASATSGTNGTMAITSNSCAAASLAPVGGPCTFAVTYTPLTNHETSTYSLSVTTTSASSGANYTTSVTDIIGTSTIGATLSLSAAKIYAGPIVTGSTALSTYTLTNSGDQTATTIAYNFTGGDSAVFSIDGTVASPCGATLAGGATCNLRVKLTPGTTGGNFSSTLAVTGTQTAANFTTPAYGASFSNDVFAPDVEGLEGDLTSDGTRFYLVSRQWVSSTDNRPVLNVCSKTARGLVDVTACARHDVYNLLGLTSGNAVNLAGTLVGSGPRIAQQGNKIIMAIQNSDTSAGGTANGNSTLVICDKPTSGNTVTSCQKTVIDSADYSGQFPSLVVTSSQVVVANTGANNTLILTACAINTTTVGSLAATSCSPHDFGANHQGWYTSLALYGTSKVVTGTYDKSAAPYGLRLTICDVDGSNLFSNCTSSVVDTTSVFDAGTGTTLYAGAYPSVAVSGTTTYIASQIGDAQDMRLQLTACSFDNATNAINGTCAKETVSNAVGSGLNPRVTVAASGRLWITAATLSNPLDNASDANFKVYYCPTPVTAGSCTSVTPYATQASLGQGPIYGRSLYMDTTNKVLIAPFNYLSGSYTWANGLFQTGLLPEF